MMTIIELFIDKFQAVVKQKISGRGCLVVSVFAFSSKGPSWNPSEQMDEKKRKRGRGWHIFKKVRLNLRLRAPSEP